MQTNIAEEPMRVNMDDGCLDDACHRRGGPKIERTGKGPLGFLPIRLPAAFSSHPESLESTMDSALTLFVEVN